MWGYPTTTEDINNVFARFCKGELSLLPWSDSPAASETSFISKPLARMNELGFLTINSQPVVDGVKSNHPVHGWGPKNGYVYQKVTRQNAPNDDVQVADTALSGIPRVLRFARSDREAPEILRQAGRHYVLRCQAMRGAAHERNNRVADRCHLGRLPWKGSASAYYR